ncbi:ParA family protein [Thiomonas sp.]
MPKLDQELAMDFDDLEAPAPKRLVYKIQAAAAMLGVSDQSVRIYERESSIEVERATATGAPAVRLFTPEKVFEFAAWRRSRGLTPGLAKPLTVALYNRKGGVGKTIFTAELACQFQLMGLRTLVIDADSQANTTLLMGYDPEAIVDDSNRESGVEYNLGDLLRLPPVFSEVQPFARVVKKPYGEWGPHLVPADPRISQLEYALMTASNRDFRLIQWLKQGREQPSPELDLTPYDVIMFDLPPSVTALVNAALLTCDLWVVPVGLDRFGFKGISSLISAVKDMKLDFSREPYLMLVPNYFNKRRLRVANIMQWLVANHKPLLSQNMIRESEDLPRNIAEHGMPVSLSAPMSPVIREDFAPLAKEILTRFAQFKEVRRGEEELQTA